MADITSHHDPHHCSHHCPQLGTTDCPQSISSPKLHLPHKRLTSLLTLHFATRNFAMQRNAQVAALGRNPGDPSASQGLSQWTSPARACTSAGRQPRGPTCVLMPPPKDKPCACPYEYAST
eukprot:364347-Chlamydomonas_euryale.AAC.7